MNTIIAYLEKLFGISVETIDINESPYEREFVKPLNQFKLMINETEKKLAKKNITINKIMDDEGVFHRYTDEWYKSTVQELERFDDKPFWSRWWMQLTGSIKNVSAKRLLLTYEICKPFLECKTPSDFTFTKLNAYCHVFTKIWKDAISKLKLGVFNWRKNKGDSINLCNEEIYETKINILDPKEQLIPVSSPIYDFIKAGHTHKIDEAKQELMSLVHACGFFALDYKTTTPNVILKELRKLYLIIHPDKIERGFKNDNGEWENYTAEIYNSIYKNVTKLFSSINNLFKNIKKSENKIYANLLLSNEQIRVTYDSGTTMGEFYRARISQVMVTAPQLQMLSHQIDARLSEAINFAIEVASLRESREQFNREFRLELRELNANIAELEMGINDYITSRPELIETNFDSRDGFQSNGINSINNRYRFNAQQYSRAENLMEEKEEAKECDTPEGSNSIFINRVTR